MKNGRGGSSIVSVYTVSPLKGLPVCWGRPQTVDHCRDHYLFSTSPKYKTKELFRAPYYGQIIQNAVALTLGQCEKIWQIQTSKVLGYLTECALNATSIVLNSKTWVNLSVRHKEGRYRAARGLPVTRVSKDLQTSRFDWPSRSVLPPTQSWRICTGCWDLGCKIPVITAISRGAKINCTEYPF